MWKWTSARRRCEALPGNNCGGCGYPGCDGAAAAVVKGEAPISVCPVGGSPVAAAIGAIMGQEAGAQERRKAVVRCAGTCDVAKNKYEYTGARDCSYAGFVPGGGEELRKRMSWFWKLREGM